MFEALAFAISLIIAFIATWIHLIAIKHSSKVRSIPLLTLIILVAHMLEIQFYMLSYSVLGLFSGFGCIADTSGECVQNWFDLTYYSAAVYTTLGFGDLVPIGPMRILTGIESVVGLALIAWTATFTFNRYSEPRPSGTVVEHNTGEVVNT